MNVKKLAGLALWLIALLIPFQFALLETGEVGDVKGLISFLAVLVLFFSGYALVNSAGAKANGHHGH